MKYIKSFGISFGISILLLFLFTFIISIFSYFNLIQGSGIHTSMIIFYILSLFVGGFYLGKNSFKKGWLEGVKLGFTIILIFFIINLFFLKNDLSIKTLIYDVILLISCIFGSMIGINFKKDIQKS